MKKLIASCALGVAFLPAFAFAQTVGEGLTNVQTIVNKIGDIVELLIPIVFAIALLVFFWGLVKFILSAGDEDAKETGKRIMIWGIIALFVMSAVWGLVRLLASTLGINTNDTTITPPSVNITP